MAIGGVIIPTEVFTTIMTPEQRSSPMDRAWEARWRDRNIMELVSSMTPRMRSAVQQEKNDIGIVGKLIMAFAIWASGAALGGQDPDKAVGRGMIRKSYPSF
jgi:hypothetical protein